MQTLIGLVVLCWFVFVVAATASGFNWVVENLIRLISTTYTIYLSDLVRCRLDRVRSHLTLWWISR